VQRDHINAVKALSDSEIRVMRLQQKRGQLITIDEAKAMITKTLTPILVELRKLVDQTRDDTFKSLIRAAGNDPVMQKAQDFIFASETWDPAQQWFNENGFTLPLSMLVIADLFLQSGSILWFLRQRFKEVPPAKGGREKVFITSHTQPRHSWLSGSDNRAIRNSAYRTRCYLAQINAGNWNLDSLPIVMNGV